MKFFILTGTKELAKALQKFVECVFPLTHPDFSFGTFDYESINPTEWKEAEILITEAMRSDDTNNPVGWRTAKKSGKKALVFFTIPPKNFKPDVCFIATFISELKVKLENVINSSPPLQKDYDEIEREHPFLTFEPKHHP